MKIIQKNCYYTSGDFENGFKDLTDLRLLSDNLLDRMIEESEEEHDKQTYMQLDLNKTDDIIDILEMVSIWVKPYNKIVFNY